MRGGPLLRFPARAILSTLAERAVQIHIMIQLHSQAKQGTHLQNTAHEGTALDSTEHREFVTRLRRKVAAITSTVLTQLRGTPKMHQTQFNLQLENCLAIHVPAIYQTQEYSTIRAFSTTIEEPSQKVHVLYGLYQSRY